MKRDTRFLPNDIWAFDDAGRTSTPTLRLNDQWGFGIGTDWSLRHSAIPGEDEYQLDVMYGNGQQQAIMRLTPDYTGAVQPLETTFTQYLSRRGVIWGDGARTRLRCVSVASGYYGYLAYRHYA